jgi:lipase
LFVSEFGPFRGGMSVLCLHGIEAHGVRFVGLAARVSGLRVVAPDLRGHGRSPTTGPWTLEKQLADLTPILDSMGRDAIVLGHSYGGLLAWELARSNPDALAALVLVDPAIGVSPDLAAASVSPEYSLAGHSWPEEAAALSELMVGRPPSAGWSVALDVAVGMRSGPDGRVWPLIERDAVHAAWAQMQQPLRSSDYRGPTLLVEAGREEGRFISAPVAAQIRAQLGDALSHVVLDATHSIPSDFPDLLAAAVGDFLAGLISARAEHDSRRP